MYFLYTLNDPLTDEIRYVGITNRPKIRLWEHIRDARKGIKTHKSFWIRSLLDISKSPYLCVISEHISHTDAVVNEIEKIKELKVSGSNLTNLTNGGDGHLGIKLKKNHPIIMWNKGREKSEETKKRLSESHLGVKLSKHHRERISMAKVGKKRSAESIKKQSETNSEPIKVTLPDDNIILFNKKKDAVRFTGVNANQIDKLIKLNKKSRKGFLFEKIIHELSI